MTDNLSATSKPLREFSTAECLLSWACFVFAYLFCRAFPVTIYPLGGFIFVTLIFTVSTVFLLIKGIKPNVLSAAAAISAVLTSASLVISDNGFIHFFAYSYALAAYCYFIYATTGNTIRKGFSDFIFMDFIKALFVLPFCSFGCMFRAMFSGKAKKSGKFLAKLFLGIFIAIIPTSIVLLLLSYDGDFLRLLDKIFDFGLLDVFSHLFSLAFAVPIGMYLFGLFVSSMDKKCSTVMTADKCRTASQKIRIVPSVTVLASVFPILFLYLIFFISQWKYYISGFTGTLPENFSHAEYAREGFFQLCIVSFINLTIIIFITAFMKRRSNVLLKILSVTFSVFTLVLISTAIAKMVLYINFYGLTQKRVYAMWLMAVLAIVFILIILRQFVINLKAVAVSLAVTVVLFAGLSLSNADSLIAKYNVHRYIEGSLDTVDVYALSELGDSAIPQMLRLAEAVTEDPEVKLDQESYTALMQILQMQAFRFENSEEKGIFSYTLPYINAKNALENTHLDLVVTETEPK